VSKKVARLSILAFGFAAVSAFANTVTYDFTYDGVGTYDSGETVTGSGDFTATFTPGSTTGTITGFSFTDSFVSSIYGDSTFTYSSWLPGSAVKFSTLSPYGVTNVDITTPYVTGSNSNYGPADFNLVFSGVTFDSTGGSNAAAKDFLGAFSSGGGTITLGAPVVTPEPAGVAFLALGALAVGAFFRSRRRVLQSNS
jgi:MYXO-CTERM domain-containing protein